MMYYVVELVFVLLLYVISIAGAVHALLTKREPRSALIWMVLCLFIPFFGSVGYVLFGVNRVKMMTRDWRSHGFKGAHSDVIHSDLLPSEYTSLVRTGDQLLGTALKAGCLVHPLFDGARAYPN